MLGVKRFEYEGPVHIYSIGQGIRLEDTGADFQAEVEALVGGSVAAGWDGMLRIIVEVPEQPDEGQR
jgi:hypothetical protein